MGVYAWRGALVALMVCGVALTGCPSDNNANNTPAQNNTNSTTGDMGGGGDMGGADMGADMATAEALEIPTGCNPLAYELDCMMPYPSDVFLVEDAAMPSGKRLALTTRAAPRSVNGEVIDMTTMHPADGFSFHMPIFFSFTGKLDRAALVDHTEPAEDAMKPTSVTLLLDASTGQPVAHWAEIDDNTRSEDRKPLVIRPYARLKEKTRYIVAIQKLSYEGGAAVEAPAGFRHLRDGAPEVDATPALAALKGRYEEQIFKPLADFGVQRADLLMAWDFTTRSHANAMGDMLTIREDMLAWLAQGPPEIVSLQRKDNDASAQLAVEIEGVMRVPLYLDKPDTGATLNRDASGKVVRQAELTEVPFSVRIPKSVFELPAEQLPARMVQYGHGFFGDRAEIGYSAMRFVSNEMKIVTASADWWGMADEDELTVATAISTDPNSTMRFTDRVHQSMANFMALTALLKGPLAAREELQVNGKLVYDPSQVFYYGISQGQILGTAFLALSPEIERAVFSVGGGSFSFMMSRAAAFVRFFAIIDSVLNDDEDLMKFIAMIQTSFDRVDPTTYAPLLLQAPLDNSPNRKILMQTGIDDTTVPTLAQHILARSVGLKLLQPAVRALPAFETVDAPVDTTGSAFVEISLPDLCGESPDPLSTGAILPTEAQETCVHEQVRRNLPSLQQVDQFMRPDGKITNLCDGGCDPD